VNWKHNISSRADDLELRRGFSYGEPPARHGPGSWAVRWRRHPLALLCPGAPGSQAVSRALRLHEHTHGEQGRVRDDGEGKIEGEEDLPIQGESAHLIPVVANARIDSRTSLLPRRGSRVSRPACPVWRDARAEIRRPLAPKHAVIPSESATPAEPELRIACEGGEKQLGRINATIRTSRRTASSFLSHLNTAIHEEPGDVAQASGRAAVREAARGRHDEVPAKPE